MKTKSVMFVLFLALLFGSATQIFALSSFRTSFSNKYPSASATLKDCSLCHPGGNTGSFNAFANDFAANNFTFDATLENMDSDKDGATNIAEINAGTFPGDPASKPAPAQVSVPTLTGRTEAVARTTITGAGLTVGTVSTQSSATVAAGQVISQSPAAGASAAPGSAVSFVVSSGPETPPPAQTSMIFSDDFSDSKAGGDANWQGISGRWTGNGSILMSSSRESNNAALVRGVPGLNPFAVGRLQADIKLSNSKDANGAVIFGYRDSSHYKYVRLYRNKVVIGQVGSFDGEQGGVKALGYGRFAASAWHTVQIDVDMRGSVRVYVDKEDNTMPDVNDDEGISDDDSNDDDWGASVSYRFRNVSPGRVGFTAARTVTSFDNFFAWDSSVLPAQPADPRDDD